MAADDKPADRPRREPGNAFRPVEDEGGLVVVPEQSTVHVLNPVGSKIYSMLDGQHTRDEIVAAVTREFDVSEDVARADLEQFLRQLQERSMVAGSGPANGSDASET